ncbi:hypothetical protein AB0C34_17410 [Nocardia sp. NPDC049220]|uniref:hypothetical protein n=1 Tax=Nocardia sp. NPDC049220 TaxID=3155273 RepID=UPI0033FA843A
MADNGFYRPMTPDEVNAAMKAVLDETQAMDLAQDQERRAQAERVQQPREPISRTQEAQQLRESIASIDERLKEIKRRQAESAQRIRESEQRLKDMRAQRRGQSPRGIEGRHHGVGRER